MKWWLARHPCAMAVGERARPLHFDHGGLGAGALPWAGWSGGLARGGFGLALGAVAGQGTVSRASPGGCAGLPCRAPRCPCRLVAPCLPWGFGSRFACGLDGGSRAPPALLLVAPRRPAFWPPAGSPHAPYAGFACWVEVHRRRVASGLARFACGSAFAAPLTLAALFAGCGAVWRCSIAPRCLVGFGCPHCDGRFGFTRVPCGVGCCLPCGFGWRSGLAWRFISPRGHGTFGATRLTLPFATPSGLAPAPVRLAGVGMAVGRRGVALEWLDWRWTTFEGGCKLELRMDLHLCLGGV
ncbi:hypothetical protein KI387_043878 [Taxus chinensis]|uniref:Uncharacterized protein n=1 Tax=Taxus chinensis TaxID=29808 RepID=A0AA38CL00_TAXCH|nr:hypothetical protein KI387_043878 [Taxus chinensis]